MNQQIANTKIHKIDSDWLTIETIEHLISTDTKLYLSAKTNADILDCRQYLDDKLANSDQLFYGINTGFGFLQNVQIDKTQTLDLQYNLLQSHACGVGERIPKEIIRLMLLLKVQSLSYGYSGVQLDTVQRLIDFYNEDVLPIIYTQGSLGASGDLSPLSHLALPLIGMGEVYFRDKEYDSQKVLNEFGWQPIDLKSKEGIALINGTQFMSAYGVFCLLKAKQILAMADVVAALSCDAFDCSITPFLEPIHRIRPHKGQVSTAKKIYDLLKNSPIAQQSKKQVQDPYSFRCIPQVHGASKDTFEHVKGVFEQEINSVTDNPNIFPDEDMILSGGNFHGQPLALGFDFLSIAMAEIGSISERRTYQLLSGQRGLPLFLVNQPGLNSGLMIPQYTAASIVSENKQLCTPASVDSIVSSNGQEDHVSMGANAATKCLRVLNNVEKVIGIELLTAAQALEFRRPLKSSKTIEDLVAQFRNRVEFNTKDRLLATDIHKSIDFIREYR